METDTLNTLVTAAIWRAEQLEVLGIRAASRAWAEVSALEGELAKVLPASDPEGRIARRGVVRAALKAEDYDRAYTFAEAYASEESTPESHKASLRKILEDDATAMANDFPYAAKHHSLQQARELARRFRETGPFGLAAD